jgi:hypothetical protein
MSQPGFPGFLEIGTINILCRAGPGDNDDPKDDLLPRAEILMHLAPLGLSLLLIAHCPYRMLSIALAAAVFSFSFHCSSKLIPSILL